MYHQIEGGPSIVCVNQSFAVGFLKTLGVPWTSALWRHLWFMIIPWLRGTTTFSNKQWHIISSYSSCFLGKSKQYWLSNPSQNVAIAVGSHGATIPAPGFFLIPVTQDRKKYDLVGGWPTPLKNMKVSWDDYSIYIYTHYGKQKMFEPSTSDAMMQCPLFLYVCNSPAWKCQSLGMNKKVEWCWMLIFGDTEMVHANWWHWHLATYILISDTCRRHFDTEMVLVTHPGTTMWSSLPRANGYESKPWYPRYPKIAG